MRPGSLPDLLVDILPVLASEQAAKSSGKRGPFIVAHIDLDDGGPFGGGSDAVSLSVREQRTTVVVISVI